MNDLAPQSNLEVARTVFSGYDVDVSEVNGTPLITMDMPTFHNLGMHALKRGEYQGSEMISVISFPSLPFPHTTAIHTDRDGGGVATYRCDADGLQMCDVGPFYSYRTDQNATLMYHPGATTGDVHTLAITWRVPDIEVLVEKDCPAGIDFNSHGEVRRYKASSLTINYYDGDIAPFRANDALVYFNDFGELLGIEAASFTVKVSNHEYVKDLIGEDLASWADKPDLSTATITRLVTTGGFNYQDETYMVKMNKYLCAFNGHLEAKSGMETLIMLAVDAENA